MSEPRFEPRATRLKASHLSATVPCLAPSVSIQRLPLLEHKELDQAGGYRTAAGRAKQGAQELPVSSQPELSPGWGRSCCRCDMSFHPNLQLPLSFPPLTTHSRTWRIGFSSAHIHKPALAVPFTEGTWKRSQQILLSSLKKATFTKYQ